MLKNPLLMLYDAENDAAPPLFASRDRALCSRVAAVMANHISPIDERLVQAVRDAPETPPNPKDAGP